jgi:hypothetical protein
MAWSKSVFSSMVNEVAYTDDGELVVTFNNGAQYAYAGVDEETALELSNAPSVGQMFLSEIKGRFSHRRIG